MQRKVKDDLKPKVLECTGGTGLVSFRLEENKHYPLPSRGSFSYILLSSNPLGSPGCTSSLPVLQICYSTLLSLRHGVLKCYSFSKRNFLC